MERAGFFQADRSMLHSFQLSSQDKTQTWVDLPEATHTLFFPPQKIHTPEWNACSVCSHIPSPWAGAASQKLHQGNLVDT